MEHLFALGLGLLAPRPAPAQTYSAADILAAARQASGGDAWDRVTQCDSEGHISVAGKTGSLRYVENLRTGANVSYVSIPELHVKQGNGVDSVRSWHQDDEGDIQLNPSGNPWQLDDLYLTSHSYWKPKFGGALVNVLEPAVDRGAAYDRLEFSVPGGHGFTLWINRSTHLIERISNERTRYLSDFRKIDGVLLPFSQKNVGAKWRGKRCHLHQADRLSSNGRLLFRHSFSQRLRDATLGHGYRTRRDWNRLRGDVEW